MWERLKRRYRDQRRFRWAVDVGGLLVLVALVGLFQTRHHPRGPTPPVTLVTLDGQPTSFAAYAGKTTLVAVWAPWCGVCKTESDNIGRAARWLGDRANVISVATSFRDVDSVRQYMQRQGVDYPVLLGMDDFAERMHVAAYPTLFVLDAQGNVVGSAQGYTTTAGLLVRGLF